MRAYTSNTSICLPVHTILAVGRQLAASTDRALTIDAAPKKAADTNTASPLTGSIAATARWLPTRDALEIAQERGRQAESLAAIITLHKFFIDRFAVLVNNLPVKHVHPGEKRWNRATAAK